METSKIRRVAVIGSGTIGASWAAFFCWALMGPHLTFHLAGGRDGIGHFLGQFAGPIEGWWQDLGRPRLTPVVKEQIVSGVMAEAIRSIEELAGERDRLLVEILALKGCARIP